MLTHTQLAEELLAHTGVSLLDAARLIRHALDFKPKAAQALPFYHKIVQSGLQHMHLKDMSIERGFEEYLTTKTHLRPDSLRDIRYLGRRLLRANPELASRDFSQLKPCNVEAWLDATFTTPSQFNKAHTMLHALLQYALRKEWVEKNVVKLVPKKKLIEREIVALSVAETRSLLKTSREEYASAASAAVGLLVWAGIRPRELTRLRWGDIDLAEGIITIHRNTSKTGGTRHIEICPALKKWLIRGHNKAAPDDLICPPHWQSIWKKIRDKAGFHGRWIQDVLRHTYASYYAKHFKDLNALQCNMATAAKFSYEAATSTSATSPPQPPAATSPPPLKAETQPLFRLCNDGCSVTLPLPQHPVLAKQESSLCFGFAMMGQAARL